MLVRAAVIQPVSKLNPAVDPQLDAVVRTALVREPADRYEDVGQFAKALRGYLSKRGLATTANELREALLDEE